MSLESNNWANRFGNKGVGALAAYLSTYNMVDQAFTFTNAADAATTGTGDCTINGIYVPSLPASGVLDWDAEEIGGDALGKIVPTAYSMWFAAFADVTGKLYIYKAGEMALDGNEVLKIPFFDPSVMVCIGLFNINSTGWTAGTTAVGTMETEYAVIGPVLPHPDNLGLL